VVSPQQNRTNPTPLNPDVLLAASQKEGAKKKRGKLKVFFGMALGVEYRRIEKKQSLGRPRLFCGTSSARFPA
jgi:hypothetical protein